MNDYQKDMQFRKLNAQKDVIEVKVMRNGLEQLVGNEDVVVGDVLLLDTGDKVIPLPLAKAQLAIDFRATQHLESAPVIHSSICYDELVQVRRDVPLGSAQSRNTPFSLMQRLQLRIS